MLNETQAASELARDNAAKAPEPSAFHLELAEQQFEPHGRGGGGGGGGGGGFPRPEPPRPEPPRPQPPRPEPPRPEPPRPEPPRPEPPRPEPPRPEPGPRPGPPRPEPGPHPEPPRPEPGPRPGPPRPEPGPHPEPPRPEPGPRPHPHPPDHDHGGFHPGHPFHPPDGDSWGWHDHDRWERGWDPWFFQQDPNWEQWRDPIRAEGFNIAQRLDMGDAQGAADELAADLYQMKGDRYAQDELLSEVDSAETKGIGADIQLNSWDPDRGTWDDIEITPNDGSANIPITAYDYDDPAPWEQ